MQSTFGLTEILPSARPRIFSSKHRSRAMRAADAGIIAIVEGIVRHVMDSNVGPDIVGAPLRQRIEFHQPELVIPFHQTGVRPIRALLASNARDPGRIAAEDLHQWLHLAE